MRAQYAVAQNGKSVKRTLPYNRQYVLLAVYEVLDKNNAEYEKADASTIAAEIPVYGNLSRFSISVKEQEGETELRVIMARPCEGLSEEGIRRAITAVTDSIAQHLENELVISKNYRYPEAESKVTATFEKPGGLLRQNTVINGTDVPENKKGM